MQHQPCSMIKESLALQLGQFIQLASLRKTSRSLRQCGQGIVTSNVLVWAGVSSMAFNQSPLSRTGRLRAKSPESKYLCPDRCNSDRFSIHTSFNPPLRVLSTEYATGVNSPSPTVTAATLLFFSRKPAHSITPEHLLQ